MDDQITMPVAKTSAGPAPSSSAVPARSDAKGLKSELPRVLGLRDLVLLIVGIVIGSGIFLVPGAVFRPLGNSVGLAIAAWLTGGFLSLLGALTYGELSALKPDAGGLYVYIRDCFGPFLAFLFGWTLFFVISSGSVATLAVAFSNYVAEFVPLNVGMAKVVSVLVIAVIAIVNVRGTRHSANLQNLTTTIKVLAILAMSTALLAFGKSTVSLTGASSPPSGGGSLVAGFGLAMISVLWAYEGWQYATFTAGETINAQRNYPRAFVAGTGILIFIYVFANVGYIAAIGAAGVAGSDRVAAAALATVFNPAVAKLVTITILISIFSAANSVILKSPRVYFAMAKDGLFFKRLSEVHPRFGTPAFAVIAAAAWSAVLAASGTFEQLLTYVIFIGWIFYGLAAASVFVYRRRSAGSRPLYRVPGYPVTPLVFIAAAAALVVNTIITQPRRAALGLGIVLAGAPVYAIWRYLATKASPEDSRRPGASLP
jgi:basic amino acid/polyamine antiporter, APA family